MSRDDAPKHYRSVIPVETCSTCKYSTLNNMVGCRHQEHVFYDHTIEPVKMVCDDYDSYFVEEEK